MPDVILQLDLGADQVLAYYRGDVRVVRARATTGQVVQFPASAVHRFITPDGVKGTFRLAFDERNKFVSFERVT